MSQRKVLKFIKDHMNNDCEKALSILEEAVGKKLPVKKQGRPKLDRKNMEYFWYLYLWDISSNEMDVSEEVIDKMHDRSLALRKDIAELIKKFPTLGEKFARGAFTRTISVEEGLKYLEKVNAYVNENCVDPPVVVNRTGYYNWLKENKDVLDIADLKIQGELAQIGNFIGNCLINMLRESKKT